MARGIADGQRQTFSLERREIIAIAAQFVNLPASRAVIQSVDRRIQAMHKPLLYIAGHQPVPADIHHQGIGHHFRASTLKSILELRNRHGSAPPLLLKIVFGGCRESATCSDYPMKARLIGAKIKGGEDMKYILLMAGTKAGVDTYRAWSKADVEKHFTFLKALNRDLSESGELVANEPLAAPDQARIVRAGKNGAPITDGVFPEAKE